LKNYHRIKKDIFWEGLKTNVQKFASRCVVFQLNKGEIIKTPDLLEPLVIRSQCWEEVSMDFITGLPKFEGNTAIMVVVDRLTKYAHFFSLSHPFKESTVAATFMEIIENLYGVPKIIVSDGDPIFTRKFWTELFFLFGYSIVLGMCYIFFARVVVSIIFLPREGCRIFASFFMLLLFLCPLLGGFSAHGFCRWFSIFG
jgi:hypothetical protein